jgi:hypothetical protein
MSRDFRGKGKFAAALFEKGPFEGLSRVGCIAGSDASFIHQIRQMTQLE